MEASRKSRPASGVPGQVASCLARHVPPTSRLTLALSGGLDSIVLLHVLSTLRASHALTVDAVHIQHGLSPHAGEWADFCRRVCGALAIPLDVHTVQIDRSDPAGIEAAARRARHAVFARLDTDFIATAHHQDDQAETLLLQLLRGAGPKGLAAMGTIKSATDGRMQHLRPLLGITRAVLRRHAETYGLEWVEDESNTDTRYRRNALRTDVMPRLEAHFPGASGTLARAAALQADAAALLDDLAALDAEDSLDHDGLDCTVLRRLSTARARNVLRWFISQRGWPQPPARRLDEALRQLREAAAGASLGVALGPMVLHRYRDTAYLVPRRVAPLQPRQRWLGQAEVELAGLRTVVRFTPQLGQGIDRARLESGRVELGVRMGREKMRVVPGGPQRSLRNLMQEAAIAPWERDRTPLLLCDDRLVWAAGVGIDPDFKAAPGVAGIVLDTAPAV